MNPWKQTKTAAGRPPATSAPAAVAKPGPPRAHPNPLPNPLPNPAPNRFCPVIKAQPVAVLCQYCHGTGSAWVLTSGGTGQTFTTNTAWAPWTLPHCYAQIRCRACGGLGWVLPVWPANVAPGQLAPGWTITNRVAQ